MGTSRKDISRWEKQMLLKVSFAFNDQLRAGAELVASRNLIFMSSASFLKLAWMNKFRRKDKQIAFDCLSQRFSVWFIWSLGSQISWLPWWLAQARPFTEIRWNSVNSYRQFREFYYHSINEYKLFISRQNFDQCSILWDKSNVWKQLQYPFDPTTLLHFSF